MAAERTITVRLRMAHEQYRRALAEASADTTRFAAHAKASLSSAGDMRQVGEQMTRTVTLPLLGLGVAAGKLGTDFAETFTRMTTLAGVAASEVDGLKDAILDLAGETGRGPQELAEGLYFASSAGLDTKTSLDLVSQAAKAAAVGLGSTSTIVDAVTSALGAYGTANLTASQAIDVLVAGAKIAKTEAAELAPQLGRLLPTAQALGVGFDQVVAGLGYLSTKSGDASLSATQLDGVLRKLLVPSEQGRKALEAVGLSADQLRNIVATGGLPAALDVLRTKFGGNSDALFQLFDDIQAFQGAQLLLADSTNQLGTAFEATKNSAGEASKAFGETASTDAFKMRQALAEAKVALIEFGEAVAPLVAAIAPLASAFFSAFGKLPDWLQSGVVGFVALLAVVGPIVSVVGTLAGNFRLLQAGATRAFDAMAVGAYNAAGSMGALSGAMAGITIVVTAATLEYQKQARAKAELAGYTRELTAALEAEAKGQVGAADAALFRQLQEKGAIDTAEKLGVTSRDLVQALRGNVEAQERMGRAIDANRGKVGGDEYRRFLLAIGRVGSAAIEAADNVEQAGRAAQQGVVGLDGASSSANLLGGALSTVASEADDAEERVKSLMATFDALYASAFDVLDAQVDYADALASVDSASRSAGGATRDMTSEQRALERATKDATRAQDELAEAEEALRVARQGPTDRDKKDAQLDVRDAQLGLAEAQRAVADAQKRVREERAKSKDGDVKGATLDLQRAQLQLERAQLRVKDAQAAQSEVLNSGAETSKRVRDAVDAVTAAQERLVDTQQRVADAEAELRREASTGGPVADRNRQIAQSLDRVTEAGQKVIDKMVEQKRPYQEVTAEIDAQMRKLDELISKYGDVNGKLKTRIDLLLIEKYLVGGVNVDPYRGTDAIFADLNRSLGLPGRATGGPVTAGRAYMVGEYGRPEVFIPGMSGTVAPLVSGGRYSAGARTVVVRPADVYVQIDRETVGRAVVVWSHELPGGADIAVRSS